MKAYCVYSVLYILPTAPLTLTHLYSLIYLYLRWHVVSLPVEFFRWLYERFRLPFAPIYGGFPVKFRTYLGDPIPYDPNVNAVELAAKVSMPFEYDVLNRGALTGEAALHKCI